MLCRKNLNIWTSSIFGVIKHTFNTYSAHHGKRVCTLHIIRLCFCSVVASSTLNIHCAWRGLVFSAVVFSFYFLTPIEIYSETLKWQTVSLLYFHFSCIYKLFPGPCLGFRGMSNLSYIYFETTVSWIFVALAPLRRNIALLVTPTILMILTDVLHLSQWWWVVFSFLARSSTRKSVFRKWIITSFLCCSLVIAIEPCRRNREYNTQLTIKMRDQNEYFYNYCQLSKLLP